VRNLEVTLIATLSDRPIEWSIDWSKVDFSVNGRSRLRYWGKLSRRCTSHRPHVCPSLTSVRLSLMCWYCVKSTPATIKLH